MGSSWEQPALPIGDVQLSLDDVDEYPHVPCWELPVPTGADPERFRKFCAQVSNGYPRCRRGYCLVTDPDIPDG